MVRGEPRTVAPRVPDMSVDQGTGHAPRPLRIAGAPRAPRPSGPDPADVAAATLGDPAAGARLLGAVHPLITRYCRARLPPGTDLPEDVAQDVCESLLSAAPRYVDRGIPFMTYAYRVAANRVIDLHRRRASLPPGARRHVAVAGVAGRPDRARPAPACGAGAAAPAGGGRADPADRARPDRGGRRGTRRLDAGQRPRRPAPRVGPAAAPARRRRAPRTSRPMRVTARSPWEVAPVGGMPPMPGSAWLRGAASSNLWPVEQVCEARSRDVRRAGRLGSARDLRGAACHLASPAMPSRAWPAEQRRSGAAGRPADLVTWGRRRLDGMMRSTDGVGRSRYGTQ